MRITIDTKHDSPEEIQKIIRLLTEMNSSQEPKQSVMFDLPMANIEPTPTIQTPFEAKKEDVQKPYTSQLTGFNEILSNMSRKQPKNKIEIIPY